MILAFDPSGNFNEGKGTTGWCLFNETTMKIVEAGSITATEFTEMYGYWGNHIYLIKLMKERYPKLQVVMEDYLLYDSKKDCQVHSRMETPKLIGVLTYYCFQRNIPFRLQTAAEVKNRWTDKILDHKGFVTITGNRMYITPLGGNRIMINRHMKDAIRHAVHAAHFKEGKYYARSES